MNINASKGLYEVMKTNLGPKGTIKMLVGGAGGAPCCALLGLLLSPCRAGVDVTASHSGGAAAAALAVRAPPRLQLGKRGVATAAAAAAAGC